GSHGKPRQTSAHARPPWFLSAAPLEPTGSKFPSRHGMPWLLPGTRKGPPKRAFSPTRSNCLSGKSNCLQSLCERRISHPVDCCALGADILDNAKRHQRLHRGSRLCRRRLLGVHRVPGEQLVELRRDTLELG